MVALVVAVPVYARRKYGPTSLRALANKEGITTWTAWRRSRLRPAQDLGRRA
jgi:hypothetical protein